MKNASLAELRERQEQIGSTLAAHWASGWQGRGPLLADIDVEKAYADIAAIDRRIEELEKERDNRAYRKLFGEGE